MNYLDFESPIAELDERIEALRFSTGANVLKEVQTLEKKRDTLIDQIFSKLTPWQTSQLARHPHRPYSLDYIQRIFTDFEELHGDRMYSDDAAIVGGLARLNDKAIMVIGHQKGRDTKEKIKRNFGMPRPEGYRKALRLAKLAEQFSLPIVTFIDTPGAYPGIGAEERGQSQAIATNLAAFSDLNVPIVSIVIGEGGSGGALAIGVCDYMMMLENSVYSVISPEGCASILWKSADKAKDAAEAMGITAPKLKELNLVEEIIPEPKGGAQRDYDAVAASLKLSLTKHIDRLSAQDEQTRLTQRYERWMSFGRLEQA